MIDKKLKCYIGEDLTIHGDVLVICQGDYFCTIILEAIIKKTAAFMELHDLRSDVIPWLDLSMRDIEHCCLGLIKRTSVWKRLRPDGLLHQLGFIQSRYIDEDQGIPVARQFLLNTKAIQTALGVLRELQKEEDKPRWL